LIVVVEDTSHIRNAIVELLRDEGYLVAEAGDGAAALALLADQSAAGGRVSLIVLDMMLPGVTGNGVLRQMQTRWPNIPVLAMSASDPALEAARAAGVQTVLPKPFHLEDLLAGVARCTPRAG
jgi:CheY-like chemotaxis protein